MNIKTNHLLKQVLWGFVGLVALNFLIYSSKFLSKYSLITEFSVIAFVLVIFGLLWKRTDRFMSGFVGESDIDREFTKIGSSFVYFQDGLDTVRGNIDKIVVGPTGVWTLEVKSHFGNVSFDSQMLLKNGIPFEKDFLKQAYAEAMVLQDLLKSNLGIDIPVQPAVVFSRLRVRLGLDKYRGVYVIHKAWLGKLLTEANTTSLDTLSVEMISTFLKNYVL